MTALRPLLNSTMKLSALIKRLQEQDLGGDMDCLIEDQDGNEYVLENVCQEECKVIDPPEQICWLKVRRA